MVVLIILPCAAICIQDYLYGYGWKEEKNINNSENDKEK